MERQFWSLRSSRITLVLSVVVLIAFGVIASAVYRTPSAADLASGSDLERPWSAWP